ncbi:predicted protein [Postia placenta Mad-698-R]|nr:predicted protein [Postia placenta Mad-698-R]
MSRRRSNKSAKVPNVKLRPARPEERATSSNLSTRKSWLAGLDLDADEASQDSIVDICPRPFRGVNMCATGISDKTTLFKQALELGAVCLSDLTDRVTHLLAVEPGSAKYRCALENKITIMHPSWITESHEIWLRGDDVDLQESIERHRLPVFSGVVLTCSGIEDVARRTEINRLITRNGGTLDASGEEGEDGRPVTDKMRYAEKFNQRGEANIQIVWEEWFWDCLTFRGRFSEEPYKVSNPPPKRKKLPEATPPPPSSSPAPEAPDAQEDEPKRPPPPDLLAATTNDDEEIASARRVPAEMLQIWGSLLGSRGFEVSNGRLVRSPSKSQSANNGARTGGQREPDASPLKNKIARAATMGKLDGAGVGAVPVSALSKFKRTHSFAPAVKEASTSRQPFQRAPTAGPSSSFLGQRKTGQDVDALHPSSAVVHVEVEEGKPQVASSNRTSTLFTGKKFRTLGEARGPSVKAALEECGGRVLSEGDDDEADFIIVRLVSGSTFYRKETDEAERKKYRTECWLERCIYEERVCSLEENVVFRPLKIVLPVPGAELIVLSFSGLDQSEACWVTRLMRAIGAHVAPNFSRRSTHLLCPSAMGPKAEKAREWCIPIVDMAWIAAIAKHGQIPREESQLSPLPGMPQTEHKPEPEEAMDVDVPKVDHKGKGKETDVDVTMVDITNDPEAAHEPDSESTFGQPTVLLNGPARQTLPRSTPPPPSLKRSSTLEPSSSNGSAPPFGRVLVKNSRASSMAAVDESKPIERIPSSESPSPLKMPEVTEKNPTPPVKITTEGTKALHETITSLLGKRPSEEEDAAQGRSSRTGKRARPPSRQKSTSEPADPEVLPVYAPPAPLDPNVLGDDDLDMLADGPAGVSVRVMYEDPKQYDEKKKLMRMLSSQKVDLSEKLDAPQPKGTKKGRGSKRKGGRAAGA